MCTEVAIVNGPHVHCTEAVPRSCCSQLFHVYEYAFVNCFTCTVPATFGNVFKGKRKLFLISCFSCTVQKLLWLIVQFEQILFWSVFPCV
jgi:hypothetical protein